MGNLDRAEQLAASADNSMAATNSKNASGGGKNASPKGKVYKGFIPLVIYGLLSVIAFFIFTIQIQFRRSDVFAQNAFLQLLVSGISVYIVVFGIYYLFLMAKFFRGEVQAPISLLRFYLILTACLLSLIVPILMTSGILVEELGIFVGLFFGLMIALITFMAYGTFRADWRKLLFYGTQLLFECAYFITSAFHYDMNGMYMHMAACVIGGEITFFKLCVPGVSADYEYATPMKIKKRVKVRQVVLSPIVFNYIAIGIAVLFALLGQERNQKYTYLFAAVYLVINILYTYWRQKINKFLFEKEYSEINKEYEAQKNASPKSEVYSGYYGVYDLDSEIKPTIKPDYKKLIPTELFADFKAFASVSGVTITDDDARKALSAMAAKRIIVASSVKAENVSRLTGLLAAYFGSNFYREEENGYWKENYSFILNKQEGDALCPSETIKAVYDAEVSGVPTIAEIEIDDFDGLNAYFADFAEIVETDGKDGIINLGREFRDGKLIKNNRLGVPENLFIIFNVKRNYALNNVAECLEDKAAFITVGDVNGSVDGIRKAKSAISFEDFRILVSSAEEEFYLPEAVWKKIDGYAAGIKDKLGCPLNNNAALATERFVAVYLASGGGQKAAIDNAFASIIVPSYALYNQKIFSVCAKDVITGFGESFSGNDMTEAKKTCAIMTRITGFFGKEEVSE